MNEGVQNVYQPASASLFSALKQDGCYVPTYDYASSLRVLILESVQQANTLLPGSSLTGYQEPGEVDRLSVFQRHRYDLRYLLLISCASTLAEVYQSLTRAAVASAGDDPEPVIGKFEALLRLDVVQKAMNVINPHLLKMISVTASFDRVGYLIRLSGAKREEDVLWRLFYGF